MNLHKKTFKALFWALSSQFARTAIQFAVTAAVAHRIAPADFGLLGAALVFTGLVQLITQIGVSGALIQRQDLRPVHYHSAFWLEVAAGFAFMGVTIAAAPWMALFFHMPDLGPVLKVLSLNFAIGGFSVVPLAILQKRLEFKKMAAAETSALIAGGAAGIYFALADARVWSLVYQMNVFAAVNTLLVAALCHWRPRFLFSFRALRDLMSFGSNMTSSAVVNYFSRNMDYVLIGRFLGAQPLGYYTLAYKVMLYPLQNITGTISQVVFPAFSKIQNDLKKVADEYLRGVRLIAIAVFPVMFCINLIARDFVLECFGPQWESSAALIRALSFAGMIQSLSATAAFIFLSQGEAGKLFRYSLVGIVLAAASVAFGMQWGILGVCKMYVFQSAVMAVLVIRRALLMIEVDSRVFASRILAVLLPAVAHFAVASAVRQIFPQEGIMPAAVILLVTLPVYAVLLRDVLREDGLLLAVLKEKLNTRIIAKG